MQVNLVPKSFKEQSMYVSSKISFFLALGIVSSLVILNRIFNCPSFWSWTISVFKDDNKAYQETFLNSLVCAWCTPNKIPSKYWIVPHVIERQTSFWKSKYHCVSLRDGKKHRQQRLGSFVCIISLILPKRVLSLPHLVTEVLPPKSPGQGMKDTEFNPHSQYELGFPC